MALLIRYLRRDSRLIALAFFYALSNQFFILLDPFIFQRIIDGYTSRPGNLSTHQFLSWAGLWLAGGMVAVLLSWVARSFLVDAVSRIARGAGLQLYSDAVSHSLGMPYCAFEARESGDLMSMIQTARADTERFVNMLLDNGFTAFAAVSFVLIYSAHVNRLIAPAFLLVAPLLLIATYLLGAKTREIQRRIVTESGRLASSANQSIRNIEIVKSLGLTRQEASRMESHKDLIMAMETRKIRQTRYLTFFHGACVHGMRFGLLLLLFYLVFAKRITMGEFFSLFCYSYYIFSPMQELGRVANLYQETEASFHNMEAILKSPQEARPEKPVPIGPLRTVDFRQVFFQYSSASAPALADLTFHVSRGETIAFVGPSGSGKTTLVKLLAGLYTPGGGIISYNEVPAQAVDLDQIRERIGIVTQDTQLFSGSIRDNLVFVRPDAADEDCLAALHQAAATNLLTRATDGLDTLIGEGGLKLSGGERQRIAIARALLRGPDLLIFDEATSSLDSLTEKEIIRTMNAVHAQRNLITILIAHRLSTISHADRIYVLDRGAIIQSGTHEELLRKRGLYYDLWQQQTGGTIAQSAV